MAYDANGAAVNMQQGVAHFAGTMDDVKQVFAQGILQHQEISTPAKGEYFLRIVVHDLHRDRYGAVEVGTADVRNVVPLVPRAAAPAAAAK
jgi:hypothetical protein